MVDISKEQNPRFFKIWASLVVLIAELPGALWLFESRHAVSFWSDEMSYRLVDILFIIQRIW